MRWEEEVEDTSDGGG
jgi:hypothetical protein